jgi:hemolysin III
MSSQTDTQHEPEAIAPSNPVDQLVAGATEALTKPRMRGWIHFYSAWLAVICGATLVSVSWAVASTRAGLTTFAYALATVAMFAVSAT